MEKPSCSDTKVREICYRIVHSKSIIFCVEIGIFDELWDNPLSLEDISARCGIVEKTAQALLSACMAEELVYYKDNKFYLHQIAKEYFCKNSSFSYLDFIKYLYIDLDEARSYSNIRESLITNVPAKLGAQLFDKGFYSSDHAAKFSAAMVSKSLAPSMIWPDYVDLNDKRIFIDLGGGFGVHSVSACRHFPALKAYILEQKEIISLGTEYIQKEGLEGRIEFIRCNFLIDQLPEGEVYFLSDILHDWDNQKCDLILSKVYDKLAQNGLIIIHESFLNEFKNGPWLAVSYNLSMRIFSEGCQYSTNEIFEKLTSIGYKNIKYQNTFGDWGIIIAFK
jgi:hypothetical protein